MSEQQGGRPYTVVVGINGSQQSRDALHWAKQEADLRGGRVIALRTWRASTPAATPAGTPASRINTADRTEAEVHEELEQAVVAALGEDHGVELRVVREGRKKAFIAISHEADLIVLGAPRKLTSGQAFAHRLVYTTACPIVVMPPEPTPPGPIAHAAAEAGRRLVTAAGTAGRPGGGFRPPVGH